MRGTLGREVNAEAGLDSGAVVGVGYSGRSSDSGSRWFSARYLRAGNVAQKDSCFGNSKVRLA